MVENGRIDVLEAIRERDCSKLATVLERGGRNSCDRGLVVKLNERERDAVLEGADANSLAGLAKDELS